MYVDSLLLHTTPELHTPLTFTPTQGSNIDPPTELTPLDPVIVTARVVKRLLVFLPVHTGWPCLICQRPKEDRKIYICYQVRTNQGYVIDPNRPNGYLYSPVPCVCSRPTHG